MKTVELTLEEIEYIYDSILCYPTNRTGWDIVKKLDAALTLPTDQPNPPTSGTAELHDQLEMEDLLRGTFDARTADGKDEQRAGDEVV